jgi:hypothetical protein
MMTENWEAYLGPDEKARLRRFRRLPRRGIATEWGIEDMMDAQREAKADGIASLRTLALLRKHKGETP